MGTLTLDVTIETNRTTGRAHPGWVRQADRWVGAVMELDGRAVHLRLAHDGTWRLTTTGHDGKFYEISGILRPTSDDDA